MAWIKIPLTKNIFVDIASIYIFFNSTNFYRNVMNVETTEVWVMFRHCDVRGS